MNDAPVIKEVISVFLIIFIGVIASKKKIITDEINKGLTELLLKVAQPFLILSSFNLSYSAEIKGNILKCFIYSLAIFIVTPIISYIFLSPVKSKRKNILQFVNVFSNCGFIGFAVMDSIYGAEGVTYAAIFNMIFCMFLWTYGVALFSDKLSLKEAKKVLLNPGIVAVYIGLIIMTFNIKLPSVMVMSIKSIGSITTPLSMIIVGVLLAKTDFKNFLKDWTIYYSAFLKLILIPVALYFISIPLVGSSKVINTMIILEAMPAGAMTSIFSESFNKDQQYAAGIVFFTTLLCLITFPIILKIILL